MTREEAIKKLTEIIEEATAYENAVCYVTSEDAEALDMAIEALREDAELDELFEDAESIEDEWGTSVGR